MAIILTAIDLSTGSDRALRRASILARESGSSLRLLHVVEEPTPARTLTRSAGEIRHLLHQVAGAIAELDGVPCDSRVVVGNPAEQIALAAEEAEAALVVTGPYRRRYLLDFVSSPTAEALAKKSGTPVLIANRLPAAGYRRLLIPTGLDPASAQIVESIAACPLHRVPELFMVYIRESVSSLRFNSTQDREAYLQEELEHGERLLREFLAEHGLADRVQWQVRMNRSTAGREIEDAAIEIGCDAVAISSSQKPLFEKMIVGSVAEAVVREVDSDIVIFP